jgi:hypothetical protein
VGSCCASIRAHKRAASPTQPSGARRLTAEGYCKRARSAPPRASSILVASMAAADDRRQAVLFAILAHSLQPAGP